MICTKCDCNPCTCTSNEDNMDSLDLYTKKALHVGYPYMLGKIIKCDFFKHFYLVTIRYDEIPDKIFRVWKVKEVGSKVI